MVTVETDFSKARNGDGLKVRIFEPVPYRIALRITMLFFLIFACVFCLTACSSTPEQETKAIDLISVANMADVFVDGVTIIPGTDNDAFYFADGWSSHLEEGLNAVVAAIQPVCYLRFTVAEPRDRWLLGQMLLDGPYGKAPEQNVAICIGDKVLDEFKVGRSNPVSMKVFIPASYQKPGINKLRFNFANFSRNKNYLHKKKTNSETPDYPGLAVYARKLSIAMDKKGSPEIKWQRDPRQTLLKVAGGKALAQATNSTILYSFLLGEGASLRLKGRVDARSRKRGSIVATVSGRSESDLKWVPLWSRKFSFEETKEMEVFEAQVPLKQYSNKIVELRIRCIDERPFSPIRLIWQDMLLRPGHINRPEPSQTEMHTNISSKIHNVVILLLDAARADYFGSYGNQDGLTPNIDAFAERSALFEDVTSTASFTVPAVYSLLTGTLPGRRFVNPEVHRAKKSTPAIAEGLDTLPRLFSNNGYATFVFAGNPYIRKKFGLTADFDKEVYIRSKEAIANNTSKMKLSDILKTLRNVAAGKRKSLIYIHLLPPHRPYAPPKDFELYTTKTDKMLLQGDTVDKMMHFGLLDMASDRMQLRRQLYCENLRYADYLAGKVLDEIKSSGLLENSLVILLSDHGEAVGEHGFVGHMTTVYQEMVKIPLILHYPGVIARRISQSVGLIDVPCTIIDMALPDSRVDSFQGRSLWPLLSSDHETSIEDKSYLSVAWGTAPKFSLRWKQYKYIQQGFKRQLFDIATDPEEQIDLIKQHPVLSRYLGQLGLLTFLTQDENFSPSHQIELSEEEEEELRNLGYLY